MKLDWGNVLDIVGDELSAKKYDELVKYLISVKPFFDDNDRILIQDFAEKIGKEKSGNQFHEFLNKIIAPRL